MNHYIYILFCDQKTYYVGMTENLRKRLDEHNNKRSPYTKKFSEIELVHTEIFDSRNKAEAREKQLKGWSVAKKKALITGDKITLIKLSKSAGIAKY